MADKKKYKSYRYYEGTCSSGDFIKELAKVLSVGVRSNEVKDIDGTTLLEPFVLQAKNWDIVYPAPDANLALDTGAMTAEEYRQKINNQVDKISDTVILKTTTTPLDTDGKEDDIAVDPAVNKESLTMYLELYKPTYIANPEQYPLDCERSGVVPKVITKEMYRDAFKTSKRVEETITNGLNDCCKVTESTTVNNGIKQYTSYSECSVAVSKIIDAYSGDAGLDGFYMPGIPGMGTADLELNKSEIFNIKSNDNELYTLIREILNINDNAYQKITTMKFNVNCVNPDEYYLSVQAETVKNIYTLLKDTTYQVQNTKMSESIITDIIPEYFIDGIYIPLNKNLWEYDPAVMNNRGIKFLANIDGDIAVNGNIVIRYDVAVEPNENISERTFVLNNHYCLMRLYDELNDEGNGPSLTTYDDNGAIITQRAHVSDWAKLSWYKDFEEVYVDDIDADVSTTAITDGTLFVPLETPGLNSETKIRYWINTNNDRFSLMVMGNPSLDYKKERHVIGACYCGKIDSFDNGISDISGNFALFTSSSTEPCKTTMRTEKEYSNIMFEGTDYTDPAFETFLAEAYKTPCVDGVTEYYIQLQDKKCFDRNKWPQYMIIDNTGKPVTELTTVYRVNYVNDEEAKITIHNAFDQTCTLVVAYSYYVNRIVFTSGVERDMFGNVENVTKTDTYGLNTSDGVTSVMMYHTKSKAFYQKHQLLFATTEEYMSKVMYGKSRYTGEYYADRVKITHGNDGPRGMLNDMLVIDNSSLVPLDELVINKDFEKDPDDYEETYVFFPVTAPFSPLSDGPNARYGLAIKEKEVEPAWTDEHTIVDMAMQELTTIADEAWWGITGDIFPVGTTSNGCSVLWEVVEDTGWYDTEDNKIDYTPIDLCLTATGYRGDADVPLTVREYGSADAGFTVSSDSSYKGDRLVSRMGFDLSASGFDKGSGNAVYYGVADSVPEVFTNDGIKITISPENNVGAYVHDDYVYPVRNFLFCGKINGTTKQDLLLKDAKPGRLLVLFGVSETDENKAVITSAGTYPLSFDKLKYPCEIRAMIAAGVGSLGCEPIFETEYGKEAVISFAPGDGWIVKETGSVIATDSDGTETELTPVENADGTGFTVKLASVKKDTTVTISFEMDGSV